MRVFGFFNNVAGHFTQLTIQQSKGLVLGCTWVFTARLYVLLERSYTIFNTILDTFVFFSTSCRQSSPTKFGQEKGLVGGYTWVFTACLYVLLELRK